MELVRVPMHLIHNMNPDIIQMSAIHFIADDKASFVSSVGLAFDASGLLGGIRSKVRLKFH